MKKLFFFMLVMLLTSAVFAGTHVKQENPTATVGDSNTATVKAVWEITEEDLNELYHYEFGFTSAEVEYQTPGTIPTITNWEPDSGVALSTNIVDATQFKGTGTTYVTWAIRTDQKVVITLSTDKMVKNAGTVGAENLDWKITLTNVDGLSEGELTDSVIDTVSSDKQAIITVFGTGGNLQTSVGSKMLAMETASTVVDQNSKYAATITMLVSNT